MSDQAIFMFAVVVFGLMVIGLVLTIMEFRSSMADLRSAAPVTPDEGSP